MKRFARKQWGWYLVLLNRKHFKLKLLRFYADKKCSMQTHTHRNELWLFLSGGGWFWNDSESWNVRDGDYQVVGERKWHQFKAFSNTLVLEAQYGEKCDEGDIVRA